MKTHTIETEATSASLSRVHAAWVVRLDIANVPEVRKAILRAGGEIFKEDCVSTDTILWIQRRRHDGTVL